MAANVWAVAATGIIAFGWIRALRRPRRRLAGLVPLATLLVLLAWPFTEAGRFLVPLIPCILVGAVEGLAGGLPPAPIIPPPADRGGIGARGLAAVLGLFAGDGQGSRGRGLPAATSTRPAPGSPNGRTGPAPC